MEGRAMRWSLAALGAVAGFYVSLSWLGRLSQSYPLALTALQATGLTVAGIAVGAASGYLIGPTWMRVAWGLLRRAEARLAGAPGIELLSGVLGGISGLVIACLLSAAIVHLPWVVRVGLTLLLAYLGGVVFARKGEDWSRLWRRAPEVPVGAAEAAPSPGTALGDGRPKVVDTSAIIDGRVADLYRTGFLEGQLVVPTYVLDELRHLADSGDELRRQRGRHGLDVLKVLQKDMGAPVSFETRDPDQTAEVDVKLVLLARELGGHVVTTDLNLNKVAELQGVSVLNVNDLATALRPHYLNGEEITVRIVQAGKQPGQGVGYLEDGTMVLVENARRHIGEDVGITVTNAIQNSQGRMIFGKLRANRPLESVGPS